VVFARRSVRLLVIPAKAGVQPFASLIRFIAMKTLDPGFRRDDGFLIVRRDLVLALWTLA
jgi:hypothetical protein